MKFLVETTGDFALYDLANAQVIEAYRPTVVKDTQFIQLHRGNRLTILAELDDAADDTLLANAASEEELEAAIAALPPFEPAPAEKQNGKGKTPTKE